MDMENQKLYVLFQADQWQSKASMTFFGIFTSFESANETAKKNNLYSHLSSVIIKEVEVDQFTEI